jgi:hypothetical protein
MANPLDYTIVCSGCQRELRDGFTEVDNCRWCNERHYGAVTPHEHVACTECHGGAAWWPSLGWGVRLPS